MLSGSRVDEFNFDQTRFRAANFGSQSYRWDIAIHDARERAPIPVQCVAFDREPIPDDALQLRGTIGFPARDQLCDFGWFGAKIPDDYSVRPADGWAFG